MNVNRNNNVFIACFFLNEKNGLICILFDCVNLN